MGWVTLFDGRRVHIDGHTSSGSVTSGGFGGGYVGVNSWYKTFLRQAGVAHGKVVRSRSSVSRAGPTTCPVCGRFVYFVRTANGGSIWVEELGKPWPKHPCMDTTYVPKGARKRPTPLPRVSSTVSDDSASGTSQALGVIKATTLFYEFHEYPSRKAYDTFAEFQAALRDVLDTPHLGKLLQRLQEKVLSYRTLVLDFDLNKQLREKLERLNRAYAECHMLGLAGAISPTEPLENLSELPNPYVDDDSLMTSPVNLCELEIQTLSGESLSVRVQGWVLEGFLDEPCLITEQTVSIVDTPFSARVV